jgi:hypothetical protein
MAITSNQFIWTQNGTGTGLIAQDVSPLMGTVAPVTVHHIQGQKVQFKLKVPKEQVEDRLVDPDVIKKQLVAGLVEELFKTKHIEFTWVDDDMFGTRNFHARIVVVPDTQVRILRENKVI